MRNYRLRVLLSAMVAVSLIGMTIMYIHTADTRVPLPMQRIHQEVPRPRVRAPLEALRGIIPPDEGQLKPDGEFLLPNEHNHDEGEPHFHHWHVEQPIEAIPSERTIAVGVAITTRGQPEVYPDRVPTMLPFFRRLLLSFCNTCSFGYQYHFYVAHDHDDPYFKYRDAHHLFEAYFQDFVVRFCPSGVNVTLHMVECGHTGNPAWAQNDAMMHAYMDNIAYYYRVNDDTVMETPSWSERLIEELLRYNPPNVGVVGPWFRDGNIAILTHDFVHRTHIDIFGFYYPRIFTDWFADDWITGVYWPEHSKKVPTARVKHTMEMGSRYVVHYEKARQVKLEVEIGRSIIDRWVRLQQDRLLGIAPPTSPYVVAMALYGNSHDATFGILRYAQLLSLLMKDWRIRVYVEDTSHETVYLPLPEYMLRKLDAMGVEVVKLNHSVANEFPPDMWPLIIVDDVNVTKFLVRDPRTRPSEREIAAVNAWLKSGQSFHCIRDHPRHALNPLYPQLIGGNTQDVRKLSQKSWRELMTGYSSDVSFINKVIWPLVKDSSICHDSVSCDVWPGSVPYPLLRKEDAFVGQYYDENDQAEQADMRSWDSKYNSPDCVFIQETGFKDKAVRNVVRARPVFWSQDYHVTPVMDIKSLLGPVGVKVIDKSLSYYCGQMGTCATDLRVITRENGMHLTPAIIENFYEAYKDDAEMKSVTAFVCALPAAMCEAFLKFNKSIIVIATIRYEQGRTEPGEWRQLNQNLINISKHPTSIVAANNLYDLKYIEYFTGIKGLLVPNYDAYLNDTYTPKRKQFLVTPIHSTQLSDKFYMTFDEVLMKKKADIIVFPLRQMYPQYLFSDLAAHPAVIYVPYQVSMSSLTEQYRMNIPLFFPTLELLTEWQLKYQVVRGRTWAGYAMKRSNHSSIPAAVSGMPDPNDDTDATAIRYWLQFADFYQWPHLIYYNSVEDLVNKLVSTNLTQVSLNMQEANKKAHLQIKDVWSDILLKVLGVSG